MKNFKKYVSVLLAFALLLSVFSACGEESAPASSGESSAGGSSASASSSAGESSAEEVQANTGDGGTYNVVMAFLGTEWPDQETVWKAVDELTRSEIGMSFDPVLMGFGEYQSKLNLMLSGGDELDILPVYSQLATSYISAGQIVNLGDYIFDYGQGIIDIMGEEHALNGTINGFTYGIPSNKENATPSGIIMRKDIVDELGIDVDSIKTYDDLEAVFATVKAAYPAMDMIAGTNMTTQCATYDDLFDSFGVLLAGTGDTTVVNWYETEQYRTRAERIHGWYQKGYVMLDAATTTESSENLVKAGSLFSYLNPIKPYKNPAQRTGMEMYSVLLNEAKEPENNFVYSSGVNFYNWGIANNAKDKAKAMEFLEYAYTSKAFNDLLNFGIEDEHYVHEAGSELILEYPAGVTDATTPYHMNMGWHFPNQFIGSIWTGQEEDVWEAYEAFNAAATPSEAYGFMPDTSSLATELTALSNVKQEYAKALDTGSVSNVEESLTAFNDKLYAAGLQKVMDLKQEQLDAWLAEQGS